MNISRTRIYSADVGEKKEIVLKDIVEVGKKFRQLGLYLFIWYWHQTYKDGVDFGKLWRFYNNIADHVVNQETVRKQLKMLQVKGLIEERNGKFYSTLLPSDIVVKLFDVKRSHVGKRGATARLRQIIYREELPLTKELPKGLRHYIKQVTERAAQLAVQGRREAALDLLVHTLLPIRENGGLWLWHNDEFIYYERKVMAEGVFHSVKFPALARLLRELGFREGVMVYHLLGHEEAKDIIHRLFGKGHLSWPWARSIFYKLKQCGLAEEGGRYIIELEYKNLTMIVTLRDIYGNLIKEYFEPWFQETKLPPPLTAEKTKDRYLVLCRQHIKPENEESYFARW